MGRDTTHLIRDRHVHDDAVYVVDEVEVAVEVEEHGRARELVRPEQLYLLPKRDEVLPYDQSWGSQRAPGREMGGNQDGEGSDQPGEDA